MMQLMHNLRHFVFLFASLICLEGWSQRKSSLRNANKSDYAAAVTIEQAIDNPKANVKNKTWRYRGDIDNVVRDSLLFAQFPNALLAKESYLKAQELDTKGSYSQEIKIGLEGADCSDNEESDYSSNDFGPAGMFFDLSAELQAFEWWIPWRFTMRPCV